VLDWLRKIAGEASWVTSVCTGSLALGAPPVRERIVEDRNRFSSDGVTSGIDFALALAARIRNEDFARFIQLSIEYDPNPPFDSGTPDKAPPEILDRY